MIDFYSNLCKIIYFYLYVFIFILSFYFLFLSLRKGIASSAIPYNRNAPRWNTLTTQEVSEMIIRLAKKGLMPSQIGVILRDQNGVPLTKSITGTKIIRILKANGFNITFIFF